ncbi:unnamed protein product [Rhizophagus irregularis]|nr:unnamed protein product [Rhizophagus irregularis]
MIYNNVKKTNKDDLAMAIWKDGLLKYDEKERKHKRISNIKVSLKCLSNSQNVINEFSNEDETYSLKSNKENNIPKIYGISQNPDTKDYIIVLDNSCCKECGEIYTYVGSKWCKPCQINNLKQNFTNWTSGNEKIDYFIQEMQLKIDGYRNIIVEWIPYDQFINVKKIGKNGFATAIWKNGLLEYNIKEIKYERKPNEITLKCLNYSQNVFSDLLNEAKAYSIKGKPTISQNPDTNDYIIVLSNSYCKECGEIYTEAWRKWCKPCQINNLKQSFTNWTSRNEEIDDFIQEMQLKIKKYNDIIIEWIPYNQFINVKKIGKDGFATAIWNNGSLKYNYEEIKYEREPNKDVTLKCLNNSQNVISDLLNEVKAYSIKGKPTIYGISQNQDTNDYIVVLNSSYCKECGEIYPKVREKCSNKVIDDFIQKMQLKINNYNDIIVEWIPYNQLNSIKEIGKGGFATVYLAIWKDGPLEYDKYKREYNRVNAYSINSSFDHFRRSSDGILKIYGISQNPDTNNYIIVLEYANGGNLNNCNNNIIRNYHWTEKLDVLRKIGKGLQKIHKNKVISIQEIYWYQLLTPLMVTLKIFQVIYIISDMGLCGEVSNIDKTKFYGVMPFVAPEVLRGKPYSQAAADVYGFGMIMYYIATGRQPFANCAHDSVLALNICNGIRPEINEQEAPKFYIDLMKNCWDPDPDKRPSAIEIKKLLSYPRDEEIKKQIKKADEYRKTNFLSTGNKLPKHDDTYSISVEIIDFTELSNKNEGQFLHQI